jgi:chromosome segregation ATPase
MVVTAVAPQPMMTINHCCPNCGLDLPPALSQSTSQSALLLEQAQRQIDDLQAQVRLLNEKASAAVDRWADYEDELARLRSALDNSTTSNNSNQAQAQAAQQRQSTSTAASSAPTTASPARSSFLPSGAANRISALLSPRKPLPAPPGHGLVGPDGTAVAAAAAAATTTEDLLTALSREQYLRKEAEDRLGETSREVEELSVTLFEQANEMVATERRARAKLEERVGVLERREWEKKGRLERLEAAVGRIGSAREVLEEPVPRAGVIEGIEGHEDDGLEGLERDALV